MAKKEKSDLKLVKGGKQDPKKPKQLTAGKGGSKKGKSSTGPKEKSTKQQTYKIKSSVKVKLDKDCGLPEAARMVLERHAEHLLETLITADPKALVASEYMKATPTAIRMEKWDLLDLRPDKSKDDQQEEIPGT